MKVSEISGMRGGTHFCKRRLRDTVVLPHELELDRVADLGSNLIGIEDSLGRVFNSISNRTGQTYC